MRGRAYTSLFRKFQTLLTKDVCARVCIRPTHRHTQPASEVLTVQQYIAGEKAADASLRASPNTGDGKEEVSKQAFSEKTK